MKVYLTGLLLTAVACAATDQPPSPTPGPKPAPSCEGGNDYLGEGSVAWTATKNGNVPVTGTQELIAAVTAPQRIGGDGFKVQIDFSPEPFTGIELRDQRIEEHVFGKDLLRYEAFSVKGVEGTKDDAMPAVGETATLTLSGVFHIAGQDVPLDVPIYVTNLGDELFVQPTGVFSLDVRGQMGLAGRVDDLMSLVGATLEPKLDVHFTLSLKKTCS